jgi:glycosyltransferase involved in cell wall biosynthesis
MFLRGAARCAVELVRQRADLIHIHSASEASFWRKSIIVRMAFIAGVPSILHLHGGSFDRFSAQRGPLGRRWVVATLERATRCVALSESWRQKIAEIAPRARVIVIPNGVAGAPTSAHALDTPPVVLFLGRLERQKGVFDLLRAFAVVSARLPDARLVLGGSGDLDAVREQAERLQVGERVDAVGWLDDVRRDEWMGRASLFVLPSYVEGMPVAILEAMARGVPVLSTRVGGVPDMIDDGINGRTVDPGDHEALTRAMSDLLADRRVAETFARRAKQKFEAMYRIDRIVEAISALYAEVIETPPSDATACVSDGVRRCAE